MILSTDQKYANKNVDSMCEQGFITYCPLDPLGRGGLFLGLRGYASGSRGYLPLGLGGCASRSGGSVSGSVGVCLWVQGVSASGFGGLCLWVGGGSVSGSRGYASGSRGCLPLGLGDCDSGSRGVSASGFRDPLDTPLQTQNPRIQPPRHTHTLAHLTPPHPGQQAGVTYPTGMLSCCSYMPQNTRIYYEQDTIASRFLRF